MTEAPPAIADQPARARSPRWIRPIARVPLTTSLVLIVIAIGVIGQGLWRPVIDEPWFDRIAYGLPAFADGRWWTVVTGTFFVTQPWVYIPTLLGFAGVGFVEWRRGSRVALLYFGLGQLAAIVITAALLAGARLLPWPWAIDLAQQLDVGPSGGTMAAFAAAAGLLAAPWRQRAWVVVFAYAAISLLFLGTLADVEHAVAITLVLIVDRSFRIQRTTVREQRLLAFVTLLSLGVVQIITMLIPTSGPFGKTAPLDGAWLDVLIDLVVILLVTRGLRLGRRWAWVLTLIWSTLNVFFAALLLVLSLVDRKAVENADLDVDVNIGQGVLWTAFLVFLIAAHAAFSSRRTRNLGTGGRRGPASASADDARAMIRAEGGGTLSWMATWEGMQYLRTSRGLVPYQTHLGVAIVLADPLGPADATAESVHEFITAAERQSLIPCFFSASEATKTAMPGSWRSLVVADDTIVDLPGLAFTGKAWSSVRQALNRAEREGMSFRLTTMDQQPWGVRQQLKAISESWVGDKGLPEMRFTLGTLHEAEDPEVRVALATNELGDVDGFLSWLPVYGPGGEVHGWTLDLMRRRDGGFPAVMEYLIGSSAKAFAEEGAQILSLSGAPLAHESEPDAGVIAHLLEQLGGALEPVYGFRSLHRFKQKFNPRYEPIYLLYRDEGDLTRIGTGLTRAFLPDATLRQFAAAGVDLLRRD